MRWTEGCNTIRFVTGRPDRNIHWFNKLNSPHVRFTHRQPYYSLLIRLPAFSYARPRSWPAPFIMTLRSVSLPSQCDSIRTLIDMLQFYLESRYLAHRHSLIYLPIRTSHIICSLVGASSSSLPLLPDQMHLLCFYWRWNCWIIHWGSQSIDLVVMDSLAPAPDLLLSLLPLCVSCPYLYGPRHWNWVSHLLIVQFRLVGFLLWSSVYRTRGEFKKAYHWGAEAST